MVRNGTRRDARRAWSRAARDSTPAVRRRATELAPQIATPSARTLIALVRDPDPLVAESAAFACGEVTWEGNRRALVVRALDVAARHDDALVRESAVAALGSLGDPAGLPAVLAACADQPSVRRRAVLALAPFDGPEVDAALATALTDSDWQTRQAAEDLLAWTPDAD
ncbi:MAG: HEAT repeat domain-containing protein [Acidimicrobiia bacterium]